MRLAPDLDSREYSQVASFSFEISSPAMQIEQVEAESARCASVARRKMLGNSIVIDELMADDAIAVFAGHWTHVTQAIVLRPELTSRTVESLERFFTAYRSLTTVHVSDAFTDAVALLRRKGYVLLGEAAVMGCDSLESIAPVQGTAMIRQKTADSDWIRTASAGFLGHEPADESELEIGSVAASMDHTSYYLARVDGQPAACAAIFTSGSTSILFCDSTRRAFRGLGLHAQLIGVRTRAAVRNGSELIIATVQPGSPSARNYDRCGFRRLYSRLTLRKP